MALPVCRRSSAVSAAGFVPNIEPTASTSSVGPSSWRQVFDSNIDWHVGTCNGSPKAMPRTLVSTFAARAFAMEGSGAPDARESAPLPIAALEFVVAKGYAFAGISLREGGFNILPLAADLVGDCDGGPACVVQINPRAAACALGMDISPPSGAFGAPLTREQTSAPPLISQCLTTTIMFPGQL
jgi:hypothetical protein